MDSASLQRLGKTMVRLVYTIGLACGMLVALMGCGSQENILQPWPTLLADPPGLLALSPYNIQGEVKNPRMFYGRDRELRQIMQTATPQFLLVGPRRIGKSSLLRRLQDELPKQRPALLLLSLDVIGIDKPAGLAQLPAHRLRRAALPAGDEPQAVAYIDDLLRSHFTDAGRQGLLLIDEVDRLVEADAAADFPLLNRLRSLQHDGVCSFILAGYWYLYQRTLDHFVCDQLLTQLERERTLVITPKHLHQVERSQAVHNHLGEFFRMNTGSGTQLAIYGLLDAETFTQSETHATLERSVGKDVPMWVVDQLLLQLTLYGLITKTGEGYCWTIPLVHDTLRAEHERNYRVKRLLQELPEHFAAWITPQKDGSSSSL